MKVIWLKGVEVQIVEEGGVEVYIFLVCMYQCLEVFYDCVIVNGFGGIFMNYWSDCIVLVEVVIDGEIVCVWWCKWGFFGFCYIEVQ